MIPDANAGYGEMLVLSSNNVVTAPAVEAFRKALVGDPQNLAARFYLAAYDAQEGRSKEAVEGWRKLEANSPADAPWRPALRERIETTAKEAGLPVPPVAAGPAPATPPQTPAPPRVAAAPNPHPPIGPPAAPPAGPRAAEAPRGPSAADVAAAQSMRPEDRQQMIRTMVDGLAARLEQNPDDVAGWQRLATSMARPRRKAESRGGAGTRRGPTCGRTMPRRSSSTRARCSIRKADGDPEGRSRRNSSRRSSVSPAGPEKPRRALVSRPRRGAASGQGDGNPASGTSCLRCCRREATITGPSKRRWRLSAPGSEASMEKVASSTPTARSSTCTRRSRATAPRSVPPHRRCRSSGGRSSSSTPGRAR